MKKFWELVEEVKWWWDNRKLRRFCKLYPVGTHINPSEIYALLRVIYAGMTSPEHFDIYADEVKKIVL